MNDMDLEKKDLPELLEASAQDKTEQNTMGVFWMMYQATGLVPNWWSPARDVALRKLAANCDHLISAIYSMASKLAAVPFRVEPRDPTVASHRKQAEWFQSVLEEQTDFYSGWIDFITKSLYDRWCLAATSGVRLGGERLGKIKTIREIVQEHDPGPVLTIREDGTLSEAKISSWGTTPLGGRRWWWISLANSMHGTSPGRKVGGPGGLYLTEDHRVLTDKGWLMARDVSPGMKVATGDPAPNKLQVEMLAGTMLGDANISLSRQRAMLRFAHCVAQEPWLQLKQRALRGFQWTGYQVQANSGFGNGDHFRATVNSRASLSFFEWRKAWYPAGKKIVARDIVRKNFSSLMLATWYCDDGSQMPQKTRRGTPQNPRAALWTNGFTLDDVTWLVEILNENGIKSSVGNHKRGDKVYHPIWITVDGFRELARRIGPYVPPILRYKLPPDAPEYDEQLWELGDALPFYDEVVDSRERPFLNPPTGKVTETTFHIGVEGTGNFIANNLIVHNTSDNGMFWEIIGDGPASKPIRGPALGIAVLDSGSCRRTGNPEYPVVYTNKKGEPYKFHYTRVAASAEMPSPRVEMNGLGNCWTSRCLGITQNMVDIVTYKQEKLGSRPHRAIIYGSGVTGEALKKAVEMAAEASDNAGLTRYGKIPVLASQSAANAMTLNILDLASLPDGFDYQTDTTLGMYTIALAGGFPPRWLWPATAVGATKADAMLQHTAMSLSGASSTLTVLRNIIGGSERGRQHAVGKFLPPHLKFVFDFQDDEQDAQQATIRKERSDRHQTDVLSGLVNTRVAREQMLTDGDLTEQQFEDLELSDDRTADGEPVSVLFYRDYPLLQGFDLEQEVDGLANPNVPLLRQRLEEAYKTLPSAVAHDRRRQVRESIGAMRWLARRIGLEDEPPLREREIETDEGSSPLQEGEDVEGSESTPETSRSGVPETQRGQRDNRSGTNAEELKERKTVRPRGNPLPAWTLPAVPLSPEDVIAAIQQWDQDVPDAAGLLTAVPDMTEGKDNAD